MCHQLTRCWMNTRDDGTAATLSGVRETLTGISFVEGCPQLLARLGSNKRNQRSTTDGINEFPVAQRRLGGYENETGIR